MTRLAAFTLLETIISSFLLLMGFLVALQIFDSAIRYETQTETKNQAALIASNKFEEIFAWNTQQHYPVGTVPFSDWSFYDGSSVPDPSNPNFTVQVSCVPVAPLYSPCTSFEAVCVSAGDTRTLPNCMEQITIKVGWGSDSLSWTGRLTPPSANFALLNPQLLLTRSGGSPLGDMTLAHDQTLSAAVKMVDAAGTTIDGVTFSWQVIGPGNGILTYPRDGRSATFVNRYLVRHKIVYLDGEACRLQAQGFYMGKRVFAQSGLITL